MKKVTFILVAIASFTLFSCGGNANEEVSTQGETVKAETSKPENIEKKEDNIYVKDKYEKLLGLKATKNKFSQKDWDQISKTCAAFKEFEKSTDIYKATEDEWKTFFVNQGYANLEEGKNDVLRFKELYKIAQALPTNIGSLNGILKLYGEEQYKKSCAESGEIYNEQNLSFEDLKNIEKYSSVIGDAYIIAMNFK